jgi:hypothetical protein
MAIVSARENGEMESHLKHLIFEFSLGLIAPFETRSLPALTHVLLRFSFSVAVGDSLKC